MILIDFSNVIVGSIMVAHKVPDEERFGEDFGQWRIESVPKSICT